MHEICKEAYREYVSQMGAESAYQETRIVLRQLNVEPGHKGFMLAVCWARLKDLGREYLFQFAYDEIEHEQGVTR